MNAQREQLKLSRQDAAAVAFGDDPDFEVTYDKIIGHGRWTVRHEVVVKRVSDGKFFISFYSVGATEYQENEAYGDGGEFNEVLPVEKTITVYEWPKE